MKFIILDLLTLILGLWVRKNFYDLRDAVLPQFWSELHISKLYPQYFAAK